MGDRFSYYMRFWIKKGIAREQTIPFSQTRTYLLFQQFISLLSFFKVND